MSSYHLSSLRDIFDQVPPEKIQTCLAEIAESMLHVLLLRAAGSTMDFPHVLVWNDDGDRKVITKLTGPDGELTIESSFPAPEQRHEAQRSQPFLSGTVHRGGDVIEIPGSSKNEPGLIIAISKNDLRDFPHALIGKKIRITLEPKP